MSLVVILITLVLLAYVFRPRMSRREYYHKVYLKSDHWNNIRQVVGDRAMWNCEAIGCSRHGHNLNVHHLTYRNIGHERMSDVIYLCPDHHSQVHSGVNLLTWKGKIIPAFSYRQ